MTPDRVVSVLREMLMLALLVSTPVLGVGLVVGLVVAIVQAATQVQESSLTFVPKMLAMGGALLVSAPWVLERLTAFTVEAFSSLATLAPGALGGP
jgi:flagellar biosynthesis protein FliQ